MATTGLSRVAERVVAGNTAPGMMVARSGRLGLRLQLVGLLVLVAHAATSDSAAQPSTPQPPLLNSGVTAHTTAVPAPAVGSYNVSQAGGVCLRADLALALHVTYETKDGKIAVGQVNIDPKNTSAVGSCGNDTALLNLTFPQGFVLATFAKDKDEVSATLLNATLNHTFPDAKVTVFSGSSGPVNYTLAPATSSYKCNAAVQLPVAGNVSLHLSHVQLQPFGLENGTFSPAKECSEDVTTPAPTTTHSPNTTHTPTTHTPTTSPPPVLPGKYNVSQQGHACLLVDVAVEVQVTAKNNKTQVFVVHPSLTSASGSCESNSSLLNLTFSQGYIAFTFANDNKKFYLQQMSVDLKLDFPTANDSFVGSKGNLSLFHANLGSSYMCNAKQNESIGSQILLMVSNLRVQPFKVQNDAFSTAENCEVADAYLVPVIVGAVLAGLVIAVLIAYFVARRRSSEARYQEF